MKFFCRKCQSRFVAQSLSKCPTCKSIRGVYPCSVVHLTVSDEEGGDLKTPYSTSRVLCGSKDRPNAVNDIHLTAHPAAVTCDKCLELIEADAQKQKEAEEVKVA